MTSNLNTMCIIRSAYLRSHWDKMLTAFGVVGKGPNHRSLVGREGAYMYKLLNSLFIGSA